MADSSGAQILQKLLQPSPAAVASHVARQAAKAEVQREQRAPNTDTDLYGWGLTQESAQELMHDLFDVVEEFPDMVVQLCHDLKKLGYFSGFPLPPERKDKFSGMEVISEREIKETAMAFLRRGTATDSTDASSHEIRQVVQDASSSSGKRRSSSKQRGTAAQSNGGRNTDTTIVMMNLPVDYSHEKSRGLVDTLGFRDKYDVVIWFPRKQIGQQNLSHAVVNFKAPEGCVAFRRRMRKGGINPSGESRLALWMVALSQVANLNNGLGSGSRVRASRLYLRFCFVVRAEKTSNFKRLIFCGCCSGCREELEFHWYQSLQLDSTMPQSHR